MGEMSDSDASIDALSDEFYQQMHEALRERLPNTAWKCVGLQLRATLRST